MARSPRTCIICPKLARSGEHIFPAALGGRRINNGIYCHDHNQGFSPLAKILSDQLASINALLSIRPDHSDIPRQYRIVDPADQHPYVVSGSNIEFAAPKLLRSITKNGVHQAEMLFSDEQQLQEWIAAQRTAGTKIHTTGRQEGMRYFTGPYDVRLVLGGADGLRAVAYVALTFFAHYFPHLARSDSIAPFKDYVRGANSEQLAWWTFDTPSGFGPNKFPFGHRITIGLSHERQEAFARISLFSTLDFYVRFGAVPIDNDLTLIVDIDPHAQRPPNDLIEQRIDGVLGWMPVPESRTAGLARAIDEGTAKERFDSLLSRIFEWQADVTAQRMLDEIAREVRGKSEQLAFIKRQLDHEGQRVLNHMSHVVTDLKQQFARVPELAPLIPALEKLVAPDHTTASGLSQTALSALELAKVALADEILQNQIAGTLDQGKLKALLAGGTGAAIVGKAVLRPLMMVLGIPPEEIA